MRNMLILALAVLVAGCASSPTPTGPKPYKSNRDSRSIIGARPVVRSVTAENERNLREEMGSGLRYYQYGE